MNAHASFRTESVQKLHAPITHCLRCGAELSHTLAHASSRASQTCDDGCRMACARAEKRLLPVVRVVARLLLGLPVDPHAPFLGLLRLLLQRELATQRAELAAARLPGPSTPSPRMPCVR